MAATCASQFSLTINGRRTEVHDARPDENLLGFLRRTGRTGSKEGCGEGDCGACSVILLDRAADGSPAFRTINSCIALLPSLAGREILTVEGIGCSANPHPVQQAMIRHFGSQCGYCTPGFIASLYEGYHRRELTAPWQIADQLCGNLCRCTGYRSIREAATDVFRSRKTEEIPEPPPLEPMDYTHAGRQFFRPASLAELFARIEAEPAAKLVAGATEIGVEINKLFRDYPVLVSTEAIPELQEIRSSPDSWEIGGAVTLTRIEETISGEYPALRQMLRLFASRQIRNRATLGGNLVTASPIGDSAPVLLALGASVVLRSRSEERILPLHEFFLGYRKTALRPGEILLRIVIPRPAANGVRSVFWKVSKRREMDISIVSAAFHAEMAEDGVVRSARIAFGGVAATPRRVFEAENAAIGRCLKASLSDVRDILSAEFLPLTDARGSAAYRKALVPELWEKFVRGGDPAPEPAGFLEGSPWPDDCVSRSLPHESAPGHASGGARYVNDTALRRAMLEMWPVLSPHARAEITCIDISEAEAEPGVACVLLARDIPGQNNVGPARHDEPALAEGGVHYHGQVVAVVVGRDKDTCRRAAQRVKVTYEPLPAVVGIAAAIAQDSYHTEPRRIVRGDAGAALAASPHRWTGDFEFGGQEHFYLETHAAWAETTDDGGVFVASSTQHPAEIQTIVAEVLGLPRGMVTVEAPRMGGGFGGKETQGNLWAALAALAARKTGSPVRVQLDRDLDMTISGKRHPFRAEFDVGHDAEGRLLAVRAHLVSDGGWSLDLSQPVNDRALYHLDNAYYIPAVEFTGRVAKTNTTSHTAFRGFGGPQGMLVIEEILGRIARKLDLPPEEVRRRNFYHGQGETNTTHYGQEIENNRLARIWEQLLADASFARRRIEIDAWNKAHPAVKRGLAITPVKFGISFTFTPYNQAGSLVLIYRDGSVQVNHGGTEMGQGLQTKILGIVMREFGLPADRIRTMATRTDKVPNTSATAASCGSDLNGAAVAAACGTLKTRLAPVAARLLTAKTGSAVTAEEITWSGGEARTAGAPGLPFAEVVERAYMERISLAASGFYRTPLIHWDWNVGKGHPFHYYAFGAAVSEVEADLATGMNRVLRVDILHDVGRSLNPGVDRGQIEGGFVQGMGWLTSEELVWNEEGRLLTHSASTYQIPAFSDAPVDFRVRLLEEADQPRTIGNSKAVGEPPLMLAISVREALRNAVGAALPPGEPVDLRSPATAEAVFRAAHPERFPCRENR